MSSLRNAVKRITHKERSQPQHRSHLGFLQKKKDYVVRAKDYHKKEDRINAMKLKASMKNPEEFYFGMHNAQVQDGKHRRTKEAEQRKFEEEVGSDTIRIMKDQDLSYIRMQKQKDKKKAEKLRATLHALDAPAQKRKHTIFVADKQDAENFDAASHFGTLPELVGRAYNRQKIETMQSNVLGGTESDDDEGLVQSREDLVAQMIEAKKAAKKLAKAKENSYRELKAREKRVAAMSRAEAHLVTDKLVTGKGRKRKIKEAEQGQPAQYKWRRKRMK
jgi:U3 small nucleolar RNA-associated protein 11